MRMDVFGTSGFAAPRRRLGQIQEIVVQAPKPEPKYTPPPPSETAAGAGGLDEAGIKRLDELQETALKYQEIMTDPSSGGVGEIYDLYDRFNQLLDEDPSQEGTLWEMLEQECPECWRALDVLKANRDRWITDKNWMNPWLPVPWTGEGEPPVQPPVETPGSVRQPQPQPQPPARPPAPPPGRPVQTPGSRPPLGPVSLAPASSAPMEARPYRSDYEIIRDRYFDELQRFSQRPLPWYPPVATEGATEVSTTPTSQPTSIVQPQPPAPAVPPPGAPVATGGSTNPCPPGQFPAYPGGPCRGAMAPGGAGLVSTALSTTPNTMVDTSFASDAGAQVFQGGGLMGARPRLRPIVLALRKPVRLVGYSHLGAPQDPLPRDSEAPAGASPGAALAAAAIVVGLILAVS